MASTDLSRPASRGRKPAAGILRWFEASPRAAPVGIFALITGLTLVSVAAIESTETKRRTERLTQTAQVIASALERRANAHAAYLRAGAAVFATHQRVAAPVFQTYVAQLRLDTDYRGGDGIGWAVRIEKSDIPAAQAEMRRNYQSTFTIRPLPTDDQSYAVPVMYLQPDSERNRRVLGVNLYSEAVRRKAMQDAQRYSRPTASGKVVLWQELPGSDKPGFVIFMPVFGRDADQSRVLRGFLYSPFDAREFLDNALILENVGETGIKLFDASPADASLMAEIAVADPSGNTATKAVTIANHRWWLVVESTQPATLTALSIVTLLAGLLVASLLLVMVRLVTRKAAQDRQAVAWFEEQASIRNSLTRELNHRVKNTLANVLSIVSLTKRRATDLDSFATSLEGRIRALSATHDLLTQSEWGATPIRSVVNAELAPYAQTTENCLELSGPDVDLAPNDALSLGLAIHELAANAAKYGALSVPEGRVAISWNLITQDLARIEWAESGGPPVTQDRKRGFGTELIEKIVAHELQNPVDLRFEPAGVRCALILPVRNPGAFALREGK